MSIIHIARIEPKSYLLLKKEENSKFQWFKTNPSLQQHNATPVIAPSIAQAIQQAYATWNDQSFRLVHCGFCYTLPERDEVGTNALFWQMVLSYNSSKGEYLDPEAGHLCYVDFASQEALEIWKKIR